MAANKRITDLTEYTSILPYDSELFGVYQPLLGWRSARLEERYQKGFINDKEQLLNKFNKTFKGLVNITYTNNQPQITLQPGVLNTSKLHLFNSVLLEEIAKNLPVEQPTKITVWNEKISPAIVDTLLKKNVTKTYAEAYAKVIKPSAAKTSKAKAVATDPKSSNIKTGAFEQQLQYESSWAGTLLFLVQNKQFELLNELFYNKQNNIEKASQLVKMLTAKNGVEAFLKTGELKTKQKELLNDVVLSPISVVHLFRQYFFELDSFLGTPVKHVWLSPGSSVELIEVHTRKATIERTLETSLDMLMKSETATTTEEELSDAVKENNEQDVKFGASVTASYASIEASSSFDYNTSQQAARETTHKRMRQQTEKLSSEIRKNFKTTFKTTSELTDVSSTKHYLANSTDQLINYELRRKMRQVGVQVQDIGTYLCWQTYVDDPGKELGLGKLVHIAKAPQLDGIPHPEEIPALQPFPEEKMITIPFISIENTGADNSGEVYVNGVEVNDEEWFGNLEKIQSDFNQEFISPKSNHILKNVEFDAQGKPLSVSINGTITNNNGKASFVLHLNSADFQGQNSIQLKLILHWAPTDEANKIITDQNKLKLKEFAEKEKAEYEKAYIETVKERVTASSKIVSRNSEDLREEERIVIYRKLIQDMLLNGVALPDDNTRHVAAEVINSIFDVDKMLYFVAPEWWRPRLHQSRQQLQPTTPTSPLTFPAMGTKVTALQKGLYTNMLHAEAQLSSSNVITSSTVGWGGTDDAQRDNYFITEDSEPARLGSSLGWLLQLDGDNMRNAFLNAPWVKSVIPIRPGKEEAAIEWLKQVEGMNGITDDVIYHTENPNENDINGNPLNGQKLVDVLKDLAKKIKKKHEEGIKTGQYPNASEVSDPQLVDEENVVTSTPIDRVYEHGFFPLKESFRANVDGNYQIFDQWIEVLPTDQVVPVEVKYDPKTGRQI